MNRKQFRLMLLITLIAAVFFIKPKIYAEYPQNGYQDALKQYAGGHNWTNNNRRAEATFNCIQSIDRYYQEHPKHHSLEEAKRESLADAVRFLETGQ
jgi:hypothetical protein